MKTKKEMRRTSVKTGKSMKWMLCAAFFTLHSSLFTLLTSCTREDDLQTVLEEYDPANAYGDYTEEYWTRVHAAQRMAYIGDLYRSYGVGYGYNGTGKYSNYDEVRDRVIDMDFIKKFDEEHGSTTLVDDVSPSSFHHVYSGTDATTICEKLTRKSSVKVDLLLFQAEATTTFNKTDLTSNEFAFCIINDGLTVASRHMEPYDLLYIAREHPEALSQGFLRYQQLASKAINENNLTEAQRIIQNMLQTYGTHIIYHAQLGGKIKLSTTMNRHVTDSRETVDKQAGATFLYCVGGKDGTETQDWVTKTQTDRETHVEALGGNSALALQLAGMHDSSNMTLKSQVVDQWFKSLKFTPGGNKDDNNVELIDIKVAPIADLIVDPQVANMYNLMVGKYIVHETDVMPRVRKQIYAKIPTSALKLTNPSTTTKVEIDHEIIGEIVDEYVKNVEYTVFYPTLGGKMCREGLGRRCSDDSLFTITWSYLPGEEFQAKAYVTPLVRLNYDDYIYYNNGDIDISPKENQNYVIAGDNNISEAAIYMWNDTCTANMKIGPFYLHQGVLASTSEDKSAMNTIRTLLKDVPVGYEVASTGKLNNIIKFMYNSGQVFDSTRIKENDVPLFFKYKRFVIKDDNTNQHGIFILNPKQDHFTLLTQDLIGQALLWRKPDFEHK